MSSVLRLYGWLIRLLPRAVREQDGEQMLNTLSDQLAAARQPGAIAWRAFRRFPLVLALEWRDQLLSGGAPTPTQSKGHIVDSITRLIRQGGRSLLRTPAFSLSVMLLLGLGVGSVSAIFAVIDHVLLRQLPYPAAERLIVVENGSHSVPMFRDFAAMRSVEAWAGAWNDQANLTGHGEPLQLVQTIVTEDFFNVFGARAHIGRLLNEDDYRNGQTVVLSFGAWQSIFGADRGVLGRTITVNDRPLVVVGVLDRGFAPPDAVVAHGTDLWRPLDPTAGYMTTRNAWILNVVGRLRANAAMEDAEREASRIAEERARTFPEHYADDNGKPSELPVETLQEATIGDVRQGLTLLFGAVTLLLLVACANVTHLFLARGVTRIREMAVRRAIGANTRALVAQLLIESLLLGLAGVVLGIVIAYSGVRAFLALMPEGLPRAAVVRIDTRVLLFTTAIGIATAVIFGMLPALRFTRGKLLNPLRSASRGVIGGRTAQTMRNAIVVGEVALSLMLVAQAGWLVRSFIRLNHQELGFRTEGVVTMPLQLKGIEAPEEWLVRMDALRASLERVPGVSSVAYGLTMPLEWTGGSRCCWSSRAKFPGKEEPQRSTPFHPVSERYFPLLDHRLVAGQLWTVASERAKPVPAVINETLARQHYGNPTRALGVTFTAGGRSYEVIGVTADNRHYGADQDPGSAVYVPASSIPFASSNVHVAVLTDRTDATLHSDLRSAIWRAEPKLPVPVIRSMRDWASEANAQRRFESALFTTFGVITLLLLAGGLAGTLFYMVSLQRRDLGIRLALGETARGLERGVLTRGVGMAAIGVLIGAGGAWISGRLIESRLYGVDARDLGTLGISVAVLMGIALVSSWVPARRAAGTNPLESLRAE